MFLEEISDDYLICLCFDKNQDAIDVLNARYTKFIYGIIRDVQKKDGEYIDFDDLFHDCFLAFLVCIEKYDQYKGNFYFYVRTSVERKIHDKLELQRKINGCLSLDELRYDDGNVLYVDCVSESDSGCGGCLKDVLYEKIDSCDKEIVEMKMQGYSYRKIASMIGINKQSVYRRVGKIKNILKDIIEKID